MISQELVQNRLFYDPATGNFTWNNPHKRSRFKKGEPAGYIFKNKGENTQYLRIGIGDKQYPAHRLAFLYMTGYLPNQIDHIDGNGLNNKWENLREVTIKENQKNRKLNSNNKSGVLGVYWMKSKKRWRAFIPKKVLLTTPDYFEAVCARKSAEVHLNYHTNHGKR